MNKNEKREQLNNIFAKHHVECANIAQLREEIATEWDLDSWTEFNKGYKDGQLRRVESTATVNKSTGVSVMLSPDSQSTLVEPLGNSEEFVSSLVEELQNV